MKAERLRQYGMAVTIGLSLLGGCGPRYTADKQVLEQLPQTVDYNFHVQPILSDRCYRCHGPDENAIEGNLQLDNQQGLFKKTSSGLKAVNPGRVSTSEIMARITSDDPDYMMPPPSSNLTMTDLEIATLAKWIDQGAEWKPHWSFIPPVATDLPEVQNTEWPINGIDYYVLSRMEREGFQPKSAAEKEILLRRVTFDLTGLPPTIAEIDNFLADESENAYEKVVDRLLSSSSYGENMAVGWLDLARYADTHGYQADFYRPHWRWRDWVIKAFNHNMSFDQFVTWQLAGDLLPEATKEQILATGFNRNHAQNNEGGIVEEEFRVEYVADRAQTFGTAFLGLTMQCARCHDHKYDPISQKEFYQLFAFFNNVDESGQTTFYQQDLPGPTMLIPTETEARKLEQLKSLSTDKKNEIKQYLEQKRETWDYSHLANIIAEPKGLLAHYALERPKNGHLTNQMISGVSGRIIDPVNSKLAETPPQEVEGAIGKGLKLSGDDALSFPGLGRFSRWEPFSIGLWIKVPPELKEGVIFHSNKGSALYTYKGYQVSITGDQLDVRIAHNFPYNSIHLLSENKVPRERWVHLMLTYDGSSTAQGTRLFLNGELMATETVRDNLFKDIVFHPEQPGQNPPVDQHLKIGARWRGKGFTNGEVDEIKLYSRELSALEVKMVSGVAIEDLHQQHKESILEYGLANHDRYYQQLSSELQAIRRSESQLIEQIDEVMVMDEMKQPREAYILERGVYDQRGEVVQPGTPAAVLALNEVTNSDRLGLAQWLFDIDNPLPARVTVNRYWQHYFGSGLVKTADDFGSQGERPSHPQLLDWLALEFIASGWDLKQLQKTMVMSATYRQSSAASVEEKKRDVNNRLLARGPSSRLQAEMTRDLVLSASGLMVDKIGGPSVKPYQPAGLWSYNAFSSKYQQDHGDDLYRRSLYTFWKRTNPPPSMNIMDAPSRSYCVVSREQTETPLQALVLMNDPQFVEAARVLGQRVMKEESTVQGRITLGFRLLTSKKPSKPQLELLEDQFQQALLEAKHDPNKTGAILTTGEYDVDNNLDISELTAYAKVMSTIMNFDATTMKR